MKVKVMPIVIDALGTIPKGLVELEIKEQVETIKNTGDSRKLAVT